MDDLRDRLHQVESNPLPDVWDDVLARVPRRDLEPGPSRKRRLAIAAAAVLIAVVAFAISLPALRGGGSPEQAAGAGGAVTIVIDGSAGSAALSSGGSNVAGVPVNVIIPGRADGVVTHGPPAPKGSIGDTLQLTDFHIDYSALAAPQLTTIRVAGDASLASDPADTVVFAFSPADPTSPDRSLAGGGRMIPLQLPSSLDHLSAGLWRIVVVHRGTGAAGNLSQFAFQVDVQPTASEAGPGISAGPSAGAGAQSPAAIPAHAYSISKPATEIAAAGGYIWIAEGSTQTIEKVDPSTGNVVAQIPMIGFPEWLAGGDGVLWVGIAGTEIEAVVGIDTTTDATVLTVHGVTGPLVLTDEGLWGFELRTPNPNWMVLLDPRTGDVIRHVEVGSQPFDAAASGNSIWLLDMHAGTVELISEDGSVRIVTDHSSGVWLAGTSSGVYLGAWRGADANDQNGPGTSAFASVDGTVQPFGDIYNFRPMVVAGDRVWFVGGPHDGDVSGLCGMRTADGVVDRCADIPVGLESVHDPVAFDPVSGTLWATAYDAPTLYKVDAG